ncbi:MAG: hypothetical protein ACYTGH_13280 [Planctomycetota bacterium]
MKDQRAEGTRTVEKPRTFSYLEFIEFSSAAEFRRFKGQSPICLADILAVDLNELSQRLQVE